MDFSDLEILCFLSGECRFLAVWIVFCHLEKHYLATEYIRIKVSVRSTPHVVSASFIFTFFSSLKGSWLTVFKCVLYLWRPTWYKGIWNDRVENWFTVNPRRHFWEREMHIASFSTVNRFVSFSFWSVKV